MAEELRGSSAFCFCGNTLTRRDLRLGRGSNPVLTCGDVLRDPDNRGDRGVDGPDASLGCRKARGGCRAGPEQQGHQAGQGG